MLHRVLELVGLTIRVSGPLLIGWMNPKSKLRYLKAMPEQLIGDTRSVNIKFVIKGPVGGLGSRSLLWFLPRFPALILVRFFLASECSDVADTGSVCLVWHELGYSTPVGCCLPSLSTL